MGDNDRTTLSNDPAANAPDAAAVDKGKGKAVDTTRDYEMGGDDVESSEDESAEEMVSAFLVYSCQSPCDETYANLERAFLCV